MTTELEVFFDVACPWCFIGERRLRRALDASGAAARIRWRAFELQPGLPAEGFEAGPFYERKFGGAERMRAVFARVSAVGREDGIAFAFERMRRAPNTRLAHRAIQLAAARGEGDAAALACFRGHFEEGADVGDRDELLALLGRHGVDTAGFADGLAAGAAEEAVQADQALAAELGIGGVPFFVADARLALSGAQPVAVFQAFLARARAAG